MNKGLVLVISGPSGVGKGTIINKLLGDDKNMHLSISCTTRAPRPGEQEGVNYFYKTEEEFAEMVKNNEFLEYASVFGLASYGTPMSQINLRNEGTDVLLEIDVQGAENVKKLIPDAVMIMIAPPSFETLRNRLIGRGTETPEKIAKRLNTAGKELSYSDQYDYVVVNDDLDVAINDIRNIVHAEKIKLAGKAAAEKIIAEIEEYGIVK
ncbi:MAG: guanylate kinase [Christensenellaceae bacterium]|nr:guanylate kinase [Christensenellaceae bacterium]